MQRLAYCKCHIVESYIQLLSYNMRYREVTTSAILHSYGRGLHRYTTEKSLLGILHFVGQLILHKVGQLILYSTSTCTSTINIVLLALHWYTTEKKYTGHIALTGGASII